MRQNIKGQAIRFTSIYPTPDALINEHLSAEALWTQVGTITAKLPDRQNLYRVENSGHLLLCERRRHC